MKTKIQNKKNTKAQNFKHSSVRGFTLLFASLVGALVLAIGLAILNITVKQITLASAGRESQQSFYSADAGVECAIYFDRGAGFDGCTLGVFASPTSTTPTLCPNANPALFECLGRHFVIDVQSKSDGSIVNHFLIDSNSAPMSRGVGIDSNICFDVYVTKTSEGNTIIESRGYNKCHAIGDPVIPANLFERAIRTINY